jgi:PKD repeat protein
MKRIFIALVFSLFAVFSFAQQIDRHLVLVEIATGTWCYYCPGAAMGADDLHENGDPVAIIENHNGDSFANSYSNIRNSYNGVGGIPQANFDGSYNEYVGGNHTNSLYNVYIIRVNNRMAIQTSYDIAISGYHSDDEYHMTVSVTKVAEDDASSLKVRLALTESDIQFNWQGMTEVNFVNRLMVPGAAGTSVSFDSVGQTIDIPLDFTFNNVSWILENCELVAFLQDDGSKENMNAITMMVSEVPSAVPVANFEATPTSGYAPLTVQFTDLSTGVFDEWAWDFGDGETSTEQNPEHIYNNSGTYAVSLTVSGEYGSDDTTFIDYINVGQPLSADATATPADICLGESSQLDANPAGGTGDYTYSWTSDPEGFTSDIQNPVVSPAETTNYFLEVNDGESIVRDTLEIAVHALPEVDLGEDQTLCGETEYELDAGNPGATYLWSTGETTQTITASGEGVNTFWVEVTNENDCSASDTVVINFAAVPVVELGSDTAICHNSVLILDAGNPGAAYLWSTGETTQTITVNAEEYGFGEYTFSVDVTSTDGCEGSGEINVEVKDCSSINENGQSVKLNIFPNPNSGIFNLQLNTLKSQKVSIRVTDLTGKTVYRSEEIKINGAYNQQIDLSQFSSGVYNIFVIGDEGVAQKKVVIR